MKTLKELIAEATPGKWESLYIGSSDWMVHTKGDNKAVVHSAGGVGRTQAEANNELSARCNPDTMRKVYEALDPDTLDAIADELIDDFKHSGRAASLRAVAKAQRAALALLDGKETP